jgi:hypothetical protein
MAKRKSKKISLYEVLIRGIVQDVIHYPPNVKMQYTEHSHDWGSTMFLTVLGITYQFALNLEGETSLTFSDVYWEAVDPDKLTVGVLAPLFKRDYTDRLVSTL